MKVAIILNGISLNKTRFYKKILPALRDACNPDVYETQSRNDAVHLAAKAVTRRYDYIFAAGGDGTIHQVVNGILRDYQAPSKLPVLGIIPLGGGNDFVRSLNFSADPEMLASALREKRTISIDVGQVHYFSGSSEGSSRIQNKRFFVNVVDIGMGPEVVKKVMASGRPLGAAVAYFQSILSTFLTYSPVEVEAKGTDWQWRKPMRTFAVANGRYYGNGLCIAPDAKLDDGEFDIFACGNVSILDFIIKSIPLKRGKKIRHPEITYFRSNEVELKSADNVVLEADGEILGELPASVQMTGLRLDVLNTSDS